MIKKAMMATAESNVKQPSCHCSYALNLSVALFAGLVLLLLVAWMVRQQSGDAARKRQRRRRSRTMTILPSYRTSAEDFFYAQQTCLWIVFAVPFPLLDSVLTKRFRDAQLPFQLARFADTPGVGYVFLKPMFFTAEYGRQQSQRSQPGFSFTNDLELCVLVTPLNSRSDPRLQGPRGTALSESVPLTFREWLLSPALNPAIGQFRLGVLSDNAIAVEKGRANFGEHKFFASFVYDYATPNNLLEPTPFFLTLSVYSWQQENNPESLICRLAVDLAQSEVKPTLAVWSSEVLFSARPPEPPHQQALVSYRFYNQPLIVYTSSAAPTHRTGRARPLSIGEQATTRTATAALAPLQLYVGKAQPTPPLPNDPAGLNSRSEGWVEEFQYFLAQLCQPSFVEAYMLFQSPPVEYEPLPVVLPLADVSKTSYMLS